MKKLLTIIMTALTVFSASGVQAGTETVITPSVTLPGDYFGASVDMAENVAIVGTSRENRSAFIFENENGSWTEKAVLTSGDGGNEYFSQHVAVSENFAAVSGYENGYGKIYIFQKPESGWRDMNETQILSLYQPEYEKTGVTDLAIHGNILVTCIINSDFQGETLRSVHIYDYNGSEWILSDTITLDNYGNRADIYKDHIIIGADCNPEALALIYKRGENGKWVQEAELIADDMESTNPLTGYSARGLAINDGVAIFGNIDSSVYIFEYNGSQWIQKQKLTEPKTFFYGYSVDITKSYAVVGSFRFSASTDNNHKLDIWEEVFLYKRQENNLFEKIDKYLPLTPDQSVCYGRYVALSEEHLIVGHPFQVDHTNGLAIIYDLFALGDLDRDGCVGKNDAAILRTFLNRPLIECPECDLNGDGLITVLDARKLVTICTNANCECP